MRLTKKKALDISIELWEWMKKTGSKYKCDWPGWDKYGHMRARCPLCEYGAQHLKKDGLVCSRCPIWNCSVDFAFGKWEKATNESDRKKYAGLFLKQLKEIRDK